MRLSVPLIGLVYITGCAKDVVRLGRNRPPRTFIVAAPVDSAGAVDASKSSYRVHIYWRGEDDDGYVAGFLWSFDDSSFTAFRYTTKTDSIFEVMVNDSATLAGGTQVPPGVSKFHTFYVRAVDNLGKQDPGIAFFNRRTFLASTLPPSVRFVGPLPSGTVEIDTLPDPIANNPRAAFQVCWEGNDPDGIVTRYRIEVGTFQGPFTRDTCATFNDPSKPGSIGIGSGLYTMTVTAIDNANAVGKTQFTFVVNHDPETWILRENNKPVGYYIQPFLEGPKVDRGPILFFDGETVPYRSTVWWYWDANDTTAGEADPQLDAHRISGWSVVLSPGTRNEGEPYTIGYLDTLVSSPNPANVVRFRTNNPDVVRNAGFLSLILDSLDEGNGLTLSVRSRDASLRGDGTPAQFRFNCNFPPELRAVDWGDTVAVNPLTGQLEPGKWIYWYSYDYEDGFSTFARLTVNGSFNIDLKSGERGYFIPLSTFQALAPGSTTGLVKVRIADRAPTWITPEESIEIDFPIP